MSSELPDNVEPSLPSTSVYQALLSLRDEVWQEIARNVFGIDPDCLAIETVIDKIRETDTGTDLTSPIEFWKCNEE